MGHITISVPDLGVTLVEDLLITGKIEPATAVKIGKMVLNAWLKAQNILKEKASSKKPFGKPSNIKGSVDIAMADLTPMGFSKLVGVSKDTIVRDCNRGIIQCRRTSGGHFKIPSSEIAIYKEYLKNHIKYANEPWTQQALNSLRGNCEPHDQA